MSIPSSTTIEKEGPFTQVFEGSSENDWTPIWKFRSEEAPPSDDIEFRDNQTAIISGATFQFEPTDYSAIFHPWTANRSRSRVHLFTSPERVVIRGLPEFPDARILPTIPMSSSMTVVELERSFNPRTHGIVPALPNALGGLIYGAFSSYDASTELRGWDLYARAAGVALRIKKAFEKAEDEIFEDGMESAFSEVLKTIIQSHGLIALNELCRVISQEHVNIESGAEVLRQLGLVGHSPSKMYRRDILSRFLESGVLQFRDGASLGLSFLDDPSAIPAVRTAIEKELSIGVKESLEQTLQQLVDTQGCRTS